MGSIFHELVAWPQRDPRAKLHARGAAACGLLYNEYLARLLDLPSLHHWIPVAMLHSRALPGGHHGSHLVHGAQVHGGNNQMAHPGIEPNPAGENTRWGAF